MLKNKFSLSKGRKVQKGKLANDTEIKDMTTRGLTHIVYDGVSHFIDINDEVERSSLAYNLALMEYEWFKEETGTKNWVLYNPKYFKIERNLKGKRVIKFNKESYVAGKIELPINASSCCGMFSWMTIPDNLDISSMFDTKDIKDMSLMFAGSILPNNFYLGKKFNTSNVTDMRYMFYDCLIATNFVLPENFITDNVETMEYMFAGSKINSGFKVSDRFNTKNVKNFNNMFSKAKISKSRDFGNNFIVSTEAKTVNMFKDCVDTDEQRIKDLRDLLTSAKKQ